MYVTLLSENNQLGREELHGADCNIIIYSYIYNMYMLRTSSELKHLTNSEKGNKLDAVSSGERNRC